MRKIPSPMKPVAVSIVVDRLRIIVPAAVVVLLVVALVPGAAALFLAQRPVSQPPVHAPAAAQEWTTSAQPLSFSVVTLGRLPPPDPRQRKPPCLVKMGEDAINGYCWIRLDVRPPCPQGDDGMAWEHNGKCYAYALRAAGLPSSGEPRTGSIADP